MKNSIIPIGIIITLAISFGALQAQNNTVSRDVVTLEKEVKEVEDDLDEEQDINIRQTMMLEQMMISVKEINEELKKR